MLKKSILGLMFILMLASNFAAQDIDSGIKLIKYEKYNEAKKYFTSLLNSKNKAEANFYLGQIYYMEENLDSAKTFYLQGISSDAEFPLNYAGMVKVNLLKNELSEAESNHAKALDVSDSKEITKTYIILSEAYSNPKVKNYDKALELLNAANNGKEKYADVYINLGKVYLAKIKGTEAINNFEKALNMDPANTEALLMKAKLYIMIDNKDEAKTLLNQAVTNDPSYSPTYEELAELYADLKDYSKAAEFYKKYIESSEATSERLKRYASILYVNKEYNSAIEILEKLIVSEKDKASSTRILAYSYFKLDSLDKSKYYFAQLFQIPNIEYSSTDFENYAEMQKKTGNDDLAIEYYGKVAEIDAAKKDDAYHEMSTLYFKNKNWDGVINSLTKKIKITNQEYFDLGKAYIFRGDKAVSDAVSSIKTSVNFSDEQAGKVRQALLYYQKDLSSAKNDNQLIESALNNLKQSVELEITSNQKASWAASQSKWLAEVKSIIGTDYANADTALMFLNTKSPNLAVGFFWRARVNSNFDPETKLGNSKPYYERFIDLAIKEPDKFKKELVEAYSYLGYYYYLLEDKATSKSFWQKVLDIDPENKQAIDVMKLLK